MSLKKFRVYIAVLAIILLGVMQVEAGLSFLGSATVSGGSVIGSGSIVGFGGDSVRLTMDVTGYGLQALCINNGGNTAPGQNPVDVDATVTAGPITADSNGRFNFGGDDLHAHILPTWDVAGCPNKNWTVGYLFGTIKVKITATDDIDTISQTFECYYQESDMGTSVTC